MIIAGVLLKRMLGGSAKRPFVYYESVTGNKLKSMDGVEAWLLRKNIEMSDEVRQELARLDFDPSNPVIEDQVKMDPESGGAQGLHTSESLGDKPGSHRASIQTDDDELSSGATPVRGKKKVSTPTIVTGSKQPARHERPQETKDETMAENCVEAATEQGGDLEEPEFKRRNRAIAQSRAAKFARGSGFKDDADTVVEKPSKKAKTTRTVASEQDETPGDTPAPSANEPLRESWPGVMSTASDLYRKRESAAMKRMQAASTEAVKIVQWQPRDKNARKSTGPAREAPSLQDICLDFLASNIEACIENGLGDILPDLKAKLCQELCRRRKLLPNVLPMFTEEGETSVLSLPDCSYLGEKDLSDAIERIKGPALEEFSLKYCGRGMCDKLIETLCKECPNIKVLTLGGCYRVTDKGISSAVKHLKKLRVLELSSCTRISIEAIRSLVSAGSTLESLSLACSTQLKDEELLELGALHKLKRLDLAGCCGVSDAIIEAIAASCGSTLEEIDVSHTPDSGFTQEPLVCRVTDQGLAALGRLCPQLRSVTLRSCNTITDKGIQDLAAGCRYLRKVDVSKCKSLTDQGISALVQKCVELECLVLDGAGKEEAPDEEDGETEATHCITDKSLLEIEKHISKSITHLDVSWCRGLTDEGLGFFVDRCYTLRRLVLRGCSQITDVFIEGHSGHPDLVVWGRALKDSSLAVKRRIHAIA